MSGVQPGWRVSFPARKGDREVTCTGTVVASTLRDWRLVRVDGTTRPTVVEVRTEHLTVLP